MDISGGSYYQLASNFTNPFPEIGTDSSQFILVAPATTAAASISLLTMAQDQQQQQQPQRVAEIMLSWLGLELISIIELQTLWAGYGHICAITARPSTDDADAAKNDAISPKLQLIPHDAQGHYRLILKLISPPPLPAAQARKDEGHLRKMLSYEVEQYFYSEIAPQLGDDVAVAKCLASTREQEVLKRRAGGNQEQRQQTCAAAAADDDDDEEELLHGLTATIITDLRPDFPVAGEKRLVLNRSQVKAAIAWLARYHARSWKFLPVDDDDDLSSFLLPPLEEQQRRESETAKTPAVSPKSVKSKLWLNGGYTYLATRRKEYDSLCRDDNESEWSSAFCKPGEEEKEEEKEKTKKASSSSKRSIAELVADFLTPSGQSPFETYIHGDVKSENLFTTKAGDNVAFFDFQYAGLGLGVCDLAKLFTCSVPLDMLLSLPLPDHQQQSLPLLLPMGQGERALLEQYRQSLLKERPSGRGPSDYAWDVFLRHWETALVDWCRFQASWGFWGNTQWLQARVRFILVDKGWRQWLMREVAQR